MDAPSPASTAAAAPMPTLELACSGYPALAVQAAGDDNLMWFGDTEAVIREVERFVDEADS